MAIRKYLNIKGANWPEIATSTQIKNIFVKQAYAMFTIMSLLVFSTLRWNVDTVFEKNQFKISFASKCNVFQISFQSVHIFQCDTNETFSNHCGSYYFFVYVCLPPHCASPKKARVNRRVDKQWESKRETLKRKIKERFGNSSFTLRAYFAPKCKSCPRLLLHGTQFCRRLGELQLLPVK